MFWTPRLCRICASIGTITYPIFANSPQDIETKFKKCFQIIAYKDDFKPKEICSDCLDKLDEYCLFLDLYVASNNKFESILYQTNRSELQDNWQNRIEYKLGTDLFSPTESGVIVKSDDIVVLSQYKDDNLNIHRDVINESAVTMGETLENFEQNQNQTVLRHSSEFYNKNVEIDCNLEEFSFNYQRKKTYTENYSEAPTPKKVVEVIQNEVIVSKSNKLVNKPQLKLYSCSDCDKCFKRQLHLKAHMARHTNIKPFPCDVCNKSYRLRWLLTNHKKVHTNLHQCEYCSKSFTSAYKLKRHIRIHTNDRPFKCQVEGCDKSFADKRNLVAHGSIHSTHRNFLCEICKKYYKTKGQLNDHKKAHTDMSFSCDICTKTFKWKTNLLSHLKKHSDFHCKKCKIDFRNRSMFLMHKEECPSSASEISTNLQNQAKCSLIE